jgi:hypothetical protein
LGLFSRDGNKASVIGSCPMCEAVEVVVVCQNYEWHFDGESVKLLPSGYRLSCQRCPHIFSVNRNGTFVQHEQSLPWSPSPPSTTDQNHQEPRAPYQHKQSIRPPGATKDPLPMRFPKSR